MKILVINCGSSSLKYQLIDMEDESVIAKGLCERIGIDGSKLTHQPSGKDKYVVENPMPSHKVAIEMGYGCSAGSGAWRNQEHRRDFRYRTPGTARRQSLQRFYRSRRGCKACNPRVLRSGTAA